MNDLQRIMYVEDHADIRAIAKLALESVGGFKVKMCASGEQAISEAEAFDPDLLLLDVMMPGMDGSATLKALRSRSLLDGVAVVFITAKVQPKEVENLKSLGADAVIAKPFDPMALSDQLRQIWDEKASDIKK